MSQGALSCPRHRPAWARSTRQGSLLASLVLGLLAVACERRPAPPGRELAPSPSVSQALPVSPEQVDAVVALANAGPIRAARMTDLPPPPAGPPVCVGQADPYALATTADPSAGSGPTITLHALDLEGTAAVRTIATYDGWLSSVRHEGETVYWSEFDEASLDSTQRVMARTGSSPPRMVYEPIGRSEAWAIHDGKVYWATTHCVRSAALAR